MYFLRQCILNCAGLVLFTVAIFLIQDGGQIPCRSVAIGTKFHMKLYITKYVGANFRAFVINIF